MEECDRKWTKREIKDIGILPGWLKLLGHWFIFEFSKLKRSTSTKATSTLHADPAVTETLSTLHDKCVGAPADMIPKNIVLICKEHYNDCLKIELCMDSSQSILHIYSYYLIKEEIIDK